jgi:hypothetical protein
MATIRKSVRPGGKCKRLGPPSLAQKAAAAVYKAIDRFQSTIMKEMPLLHAHLSKHVKKEGTTLAYYPPHAFPPWDIG